MIISAIAPEPDSLGERADCRSPAVADRLRQALMSSLAGCRFSLSSRSQQSVAERPFQTQDGSKCTGITASCFVESTGFQQSYARPKNMPGSPSIGLHLRDCRRIIRCVGRCDRSSLGRCMTWFGSVSPKWVRTSRCRVRRVGLEPSTVTANLTQDTRS